MKQKEEKYESDSTPSFHVRGIQSLRRIESLSVYSTKSKQDLYRLCGS
jgi:hypothetical protein